MSGDSSSEILAAAERLLGGAVKYLFTPGHIARVGEAEVQVLSKKLLTKADSEAYEVVRLAEAHVIADAVKQAGVAGLLRRAKTRLVEDEVRKQRNFESVLVQALELSIDSPAQSRPIDEDWFAKFFEFSSQVSNDDVQKLWAHVLANHARAACSTVSMMALDALRLVDAEMAVTFQKVAILQKVITVVGARNFDTPYNPRFGSSGLIRLEEAGLLRPKDPFDLVFYLDGVFGAAVRRDKSDRVGDQPFYELSLRGEEIANCIMPGYDQESFDPFDHMSKNEVLEEIKGIIWGLTTIGDEHFVQLYFDDERNKFHSDERRAIRFLSLGSIDPYKGLAHINSKLPEDYIVAPIIRNLMDLYYVEKRVPFDDEIR